MAVADTGRPQVFFDHMDFPLRKLANHVFAGCGHLHKANATAVVFAVALPVLLDFLLDKRAGLLLQRGVNSESTCVRMRER